MTLERVPGEANSPRTPNPRAGEVADGIERAINEHRLTPGMKLSEDEVGEIFGVSRTIVRAAPVPHTRSPATVARTTIGPDTPLGKVSFGATA